MSIRGGLMKGNVVGLIISSSGVRDLSVCRHDSGGSCRFPEKRRRPRRRSTPSVQAGDVKDSLRVQSGGSLLSCRDIEKETETQNQTLGLLLYIILVIFKYYFNFLILSVACEWINACGATMHD